MANVLGSALAFLLANAQAVADCDLTDQDAENLVLTAQATRYTPVIPPVAGIFVGGRTKLCALVEVEIDDEGNVRSALVARSDPEGVLDREAVRAARRLKFDSGQVSALALFPNGD